ncbi:MAG TPA: hypothetical protein VIR00_13485 [Micromonosporaceae bacterium]
MPTATAPRTNLGGGTRQHAAIRPQRDVRIEHGDERGEVAAPGGSEEPSTTARQDGLLLRVACGHRVAPGHRADDRVRDVRLQRLLPPRRTRAQHVQAHPSSQ